MHRVIIQERGDIGKIRGVVLIVFVLRVIWSKVLALIIVLIEILILIILVLICIILASYHILVCITWAKVIRI